MGKPNTASTIRQSIAKQVAAAYAQNPNVDVIYMGGSAACGHADRFSDIEIGVYWSQPPTEEDRQKAVEATGGDLINLWPFDENNLTWDDGFKIGRNAKVDEKSGILVEVIHIETRLLKTFLEDVLTKFDPSLLKQNMLASVVHGLPLHNPQLVSEWQNRAAHYPHELSLAVIKQHAQIDHYWRGEMWLHRGPNLNILYSSFVDIQHKLLHTLLGLNKIYYFGFKWLENIITRFSISPPNLLNRLNHAFTAPLCLLL